MCNEESVFGERRKWGELGWIIVRNLLGEYSSLWEESWTLVFSLLVEPLNSLILLN